MCVAMCGWWRSRVSGVVAGWRHINHERKIKGVNLIWRPCLLFLLFSFLFGTAESEEDFMWALLCDFYAIHFFWLFFPGWNSWKRERWTWNSMRNSKMPLIAAPGIVDLHLWVATVTNESRMHAAAVFEWLWIACEIAHKRPGSEFGAINKRGKKKRELLSLPFHLSLQFPFWSFQLSCYAFLCRMVEGKLQQTFI